MLAAMGYQPGKGLGKSADGRATPLDVKLKAGRTGLGVDEAKRRRAVAAQQERQERGESGSSCPPSLDVLPVHLGQATGRTPSCGLSHCCHGDNACAEAKRHRGHEDMRSSFLHGRAASFAQRRAAEQLAKARAVRLRCLQCMPASSLAGRVWLLTRIACEVTRTPACALPTGSAAPQRCMRAGVRDPGPQGWHAGEPHVGAAAASRRRGGCRGCGRRQQTAGRGCLGGAARGAAPGRGAGAPAAAARLLPLLRLPGRPSPMLNAAAMRRSCCLPQCTSGTHRNILLHHVPMRSIETKMTWQRRVLENGKTTIESHHGFETANVAVQHCLEYSNGRKAISLVHSHGKQLMLSVVRLSAWYLPRHSRHTDAVSGTKLTSLTSCWRLDHTPSGKYCSATPRTRHGGRYTAKLH